MSRSARSEAEADAPAPKRPPHELRRVVSLREGQTITLTSSVDFLTLSGDERDFVYHLIDRIDEFERRAGLATT